MALVPTFGKVGGGASDGVEAFGSVSVIVSVPILAPFNSFVYVFSPYEVSVQVKTTVVSPVAKVCPSKCVSFASCIISV